MDVLVIDDQPVYSEGLSIILQRKFPGFRVKSFANSGAVLNSSDHSLSATDLIFLGVNSPSSQSAKLLEQMLKSLPVPPVIVLSSMVDNQQIKKILDLGVSGIIPKDYTTDEMFNAIDECCQGHVHIPLETQKKIDQLSLLASEQKTIASSLQITKRQLQVLKLMSKRLTNDEIAEKLCVSKATIKSHINKIYAALDVSCRKKCISRAYDLGILYRNGE